MSSLGGVFSQTLQSITDAKLAQLGKNRTLFEHRKAELLTAVQAETNETKQLQILLDGVKESFFLKSAKRKPGDRDDESGRVLVGGTNNRRLEVLINNIQRFLGQARYDPSISPKLLRDWGEALMKPLEIQSLKYQYASLYGELVNEWLSAEKAAEASRAKENESVEGFEKVDWKKKDEMRAAWEDLVFQPFETNQMAIDLYLTDLFSLTGNHKKKVNKNVLQALGTFREKVEAFESTLASPGQFDNQVL